MTARFFHLDECAVIDRAYNLSQEVARRERVIMSAP